MTSTGDRGSGLLSTTFGVGFFLALVTFAAHVLVGLWVTSTVEAVASDAATAVALAGGGPGRWAAEEADALREARRLLGRHADRVHLQFEHGADDGSVVLHVRTEGMGLVAGLPLGGRLDRRIVVRREDR